MSRPHYATFILVCLVGGCGSTAEETASAPTPRFTLQEAMDPETCVECHEGVYADWKGSMHAFASHDPVFTAMNRRGQRETNGELGDFCVRCHAPMAVELGMTSDGLNLDELPDYVRGVTCYTCHNAIAVEGTHNNPLVLAGDAILRGSIANPVPNTAHDMAYSALLDRSRVESSSLCGSCHDIVTPQGVHIERTYLEWTESLFSTGDFGAVQTCGSCHMGSSRGVAADYPGVPLRKIHSHRMPAVDKAPAPWPGREEQALEIEEELATTVFASFCVVDNGDGQGRIDVKLENIGAGHSFPSGAAQDRRVWVEVVAEDAEGQVLFSSGVLEDSEALVDLEATDPNLWRIGDKGFKEDGSPAHMFWDIVSIESNLLPVAKTLDVFSPDYFDTHRLRSYWVPSGIPSRVTVRVRMRALGRDFVQDLIDSGDLDAGYLDTLETYDLGLAALEWKATESGGYCVPEVLTE